MLIIYILTRKPQLPAEILCQLVEKLGITPDKDLATCLYTAIYTDCGSFRFANINTGNHAARQQNCLEYGARPNEISDALGTHTRANIEMLGKVLQTLSFYNDGAVSTIEINSDLYDKEVNTDNFISFARYIEGVDVAVLFKAVEPSVTRVSMRSQKTDVAEIALSFGGGGHTGLPDARWNAFGRSPSKKCLKLSVKPYDGRNY